MCAKNFYESDTRTDVDVDDEADVEVGDESSSSNFENGSIRKSSRVRFVVSVGVVIFSMVFNGTIYGYTSPALLSMQHENMVDSYLNKYNDSDTGNSSNNNGVNDNSSFSISTISEFSYDVEIIRNEP